MTTTDTPTDTTEQYQPEVWVYAGTRIGDDGKRIHAWHDPVEGKLRYWSDRASYHIGAGYTMQIDRRDEGVYRRGDPQFARSIADDLDPALRVEWEIADERTTRRLNRQRAERKVKQQGTAIDQAAQDVCALAAKVKTFGELETLIAAVRARMIDAWDKS